MKLALCQIEIEPADVETNLDRALTAIEETASEGADLVVLPELFTVGYFAFDAYERSAESLSGRTLSTIADAAREHGVGVLAGSVVEDLAATAVRCDASVPKESGMANTSVLFDRDGSRLAHYRKNHLFGYGSIESRMLVAGDKLGIATFDGMTIGLTTCYDLRFPELYRELLTAGVTLTLVPSAWPYPRVEHWTTLSRARAIENQYYVAVANGAGTIDETTLLGRSTVYDPWGTPIASCDDGPTVVTAEVDPDRVATVREEFPAWQDRRY